MVRELILYPDERINIASANVRSFDDELYKLIEDMKDTITFHNADGLAAIQVAIPLSVVIVKNKDGGWLELLNPRIIKAKGKSISTETSLYLPDIEEQIPRDENITIIYQDRNGDQKSMRVDGELGYLLQRKIDYTFGGTFANKLDRKNRKRVEKRLSINGVQGEFNANSNFSKREYFKSAINKLLFFEALFLFAPFFKPKEETLLSFYHYGIFATVASILLTIGYFIYAKYEADKMISCTGCQVVSFSAVAIKYFLMTIILFLGTYYWVNPS